MTDNDIVIKLGSSRPEVIRKLLADNNAKWATFRGMPHPDTTERIEYLCGASKIVATHDIAANTLTIHAVPLVVQDKPGLYPTPSDADRTKEVLAKAPEHLNFNDMVYMRQKGVIGKYETQWNIKLDPAGHVAKLAGITMEKKTGQDVSVGKPRADLKIDPSEIKPQTKAMESVDEDDTERPSLRILGDSPLP